MYPNTAPFNPEKNFFSWQGSGLSSLGRLILWVTTQTQLFLTPPKNIFFSWQGSDLSSLGMINYEKTPCLSDDPLFLPKRWQIFPRGCSAQCPVDRSWCAQRCCDGAATESLLRRSRCCDGAAQTSSVALTLRVASATELVLLRRS